MMSTWIVLRRGATQLASRALSSTRASSYPLHIKVPPMGSSLKPKAEKDGSEKTHTAVRDLLRDVEDNGDEALDRYALEYDGLPARRLTDAEIAEVMTKVTERELADIEFAQANIRRFAEHQLASLSDIEVEVRPGVHLGHKNIPVRSCLCYVPGGKFPMIASAHMSVLTAKVAGVDRVVACTPPYGGEAPKLTVAAMHMAGADEIWVMGGPWALAAAVHGTERLAPVDFVVGPGNQFVAEAKRQLFGKVGIDLLAGPTETLLVCDDSVDAELCATDLLGQAEHGFNSPAVLVTTSEKLARETCVEVERQLETLATAETAAASWRDYGEVIVAESDEQMLQLADQICSEHVQVMHRDWRFFLDRLRNYGAIFCGEETNVSYGDKVIGTNHTLPTNHAGKYTGGLWVGKFIKTHTYQYLTSKEASVEMGEVCARLCDYENFAGHAEQARIRVRRWKA
jgi:sulfopropanediol 3-dehydrogenase